MNEKIFVFRVSKGHESGNPLGRCDIDIRDVIEQRDRITDADLKIIDYDNNGHLQYIQDELWSSLVLRQGWGIHGTDLRMGSVNWIKNYILEGKIWWDAEISCQQAKGRWNILRRMLNIKSGDILILPKTSIDIIDDYNHFTVCQADGEYFYEYHEEIGDFSHCIKIKNLKTYPYLFEYLDRYDFSSPYLWAITEVKNHHSRFTKVTSFLENNYLRNF